MAKLIGIILIYVGGILLTGFLAIGLLLGIFYLKKRFSHMTEETWDFYFKGISIKGFLLRGLVIYCIALCLIGSLSYLLFKGLNYDYSLLLSIIFVPIGVLYAVFEYLKNKDKLHEKLNRLYQ
ncbi:hypothetical protein [[Ruminococcus] torques]|uniref:hypothetical protein n=1 Tax=[Ruminococcus] torques TaxID=33039 RepID=UPI00351FA546